ncbi:hypothetical protein DFH06DRAFT_988705, partial [Mycena polygramma]
MYRTDFEGWTRRDIAVLRAQAYAYRDAPSQAARDAIFARYGVRWSEFWRLPYWDPTRMAVVDSMHCIFEGLVHHHSRRVLRIDTKLAKRKETMGLVGRVIAQTVTPGWVGSVPHNYGDSNAGTIKAAEWRVLATIYLPIALILIWGDHDPSTQPQRLLQMLDHSMALFTAVILVCRYTMTRERASKYRNLLKFWVDGLPDLHPHTRSHAMRPNVHMAFHIYDFLILFGPVISWWTFPFERVIGFLERINTNSHIG